MPFVTFEGVEGCGKSTQLALAAARLRERGRRVVETREPGGTAAGERLRAILLDPDFAALDPVTEWLLIEADRRSTCGKS
jgi:dTMP kinase